MKKVYLMKGMAAMTLGLVVASCNKADFFNAYADQEVKEQEFTENFQNNVMGGKTIDPNQNWSTATAATVSVNVNLDYQETYTVYITAGSANLGSAAYFGVASVKSGDKANIRIAKPNDVAYLQAICYDKDNHATVYPFYMDGTSATVNIGTVSNNKRAVSTGNRWSVETKSMPDLTAYTTGELYEMEEDFNTKNKYEVSVGQDDPSEKHLKITGNYTGCIARLQSYGGQSVYVTGTWTVQNYQWDGQKVTGGSVVVVGEGGKIVVPEGHKLVTNANNEMGTTGLIYVMPGGTIEGAGEMEFSNGTETYSYNAGTITVKKININGGTLYNAGTIGDGVNNPAMTSPGWSDNLGKFVNVGHATLASMDGAGMAFENACNLKVIGQMTLGKDSKMDNGAYVEAGEFGGSHCVLYIGENAYIKITDQIGNFNNFGIWGPATNSWAYLEVPNKITEMYAPINWTDGDSEGKCFGLDRLYVIVPEPYDMVDVNGEFKYNPRGDGRTALVYAWLNGAHSACSYSDPARQTCAWGTSPDVTLAKDESDDCGTSFIKQESPRPQPNYIYYAFEDLGTTDDFDFNDVVIRVSAPNANGVATVELVAAGGTLPTVVTYGEEALGSEVHQTFGVEVGTMVNTGAEKKEFKTLGTIEGLTAQTDMAQLPFGITVTGNGGQVTRVVNSVKNNGKAPLMIVVSGDENGKWFWATERTNITAAYAQFGEWGANATTNANWYKNATEGKVWKW